MEGKLTGTDVYQLCLNNNWFTRGTTSHYEKVMQAADNGMDTHDLAMAIWICSDAVELEDVEGKIKDYLRWEKPQVERSDKRA